MELRELALPTGLVYAILTLSGTIISLLSTLLQCSKTGIGTSALQGLMNAVLPALVFALASYFPVIRKPFTSPFEMFGVSPDTSQTFGIGYLVMLASWVTVVWNINKSEKAVCNPDVAEMTEFKTKLIAELKQKEMAREKNATRQSHV